MCFLFVSKRSYIGYYIICMTVPLTSSVKCSVLDVYLGSEYNSLNDLVQSQQIGAMNVSNYFCYATQAIKKDTSNGS